MIDLHAHSTCSDGTLAPEALAELGRRVGLRALALTDHDTTCGLPAFLAACGNDMMGIGGVEISTASPGGGMHMLGYFVDPGCRALEDELQHIRASRDERNANMLQRLASLDIHISMTEVIAVAGGDVISRVHIARVLQDHGHVSSMREAFDRYLARGKPGYCDRYRPSPSEGISLIHEAGGLAVLAHPGVNRRRLRQIERTVRELVDLGLDGVEVYYPEHSPDLVDGLLKLVKALELVATGGSDYHGEGVSDRRLGRGFGKLRVPDSVLEALETRRSG